MRTGDNTMIGSIAALASSGHTDETLLQKEIHRFVNFIAVLAIITAFVCFGIGMGRKQPPISTFVNGFIVVIVANVPEGLPATVTSCLSITAKRMASRNVLIKRTDIIESLGSASVIASDKTGTLTQNKMTVENMWYNRTVFNAYAGARPDLLEMMQATASHEAGKEGGPPVSFRDRPQMTEGGSHNEKSNSTFERNTFTVSAFASFAKARAAARAAHPSDPPLSSVQLTLCALWGDGGQRDSRRTLLPRAPPQISWERFSPHAKLLTIAGVCNRARYEDSAPTPDDKTNKGNALTVRMETGERKILGDASDSGLLRYCDKMFPVAIARANFPKQFEVPFNSVNKFAITVVADPGNSKQNLVFMKGAPEIILSRCSDYMYNGRTRAIDEDFKEEWQNAYERFGSMGERVLGFAYKEIPAHKAEEYAQDKEGELVPTKGLVFCGLISLVDPPRPGVAEAITTCRKAGIRVTMVTGDHPLTAEAIARKVNIITLPTRRDVAMEEGVPEFQIPISDERVGAMVVTGAQVNDLTQQDWDDILSKKEVVFARTSPQQKLKLVENYQRRGEVVAVTGDGVNDSPALKRAQIGVAMGSENASDVAREAADIILMDDNFASIVGAIEEGRTLFDNLKKTIAYTLAHLWPELVPVFLNLAFSFPLGLNGLMILTIDLLTEQGPAISLAFEGSEAAVMERKPRNVKTDRLVSAPSLFYTYIVAGLANALTCMWCYFMVFVSYKIQVRHVAFSVPDYFTVPDARLSTRDITAYRKDANSNPAWWMVLCGGDRRDDIAATIAWNFGLEFGFHNSTELGVEQFRAASPLAVDAVAQGLIGGSLINGTSFSTPTLAYNGTAISDALRGQGCLTFSPSTQWKAFSEAQSAWYLTLIMCQFWHIWACRTRIVSLFQQGVFSNVVTIYGAVTAVGIMVGVIYIPAFHIADAFQTMQLRGWFWLPHFAYGIYILSYNEFVKWFVRNRPHSFVAQYMGW